MKALLGRMGDFFVNPMMVKELRAGTRGARFFFAQLIVLLLFTTAILIAFAAFAAEMVGRVDRVDPSAVGRGVYLISQCIQLAVVFLIVPAFAAGAITIERERQTYDILVSTRLRPFQIAWGKFSAALTMVGLIFVSLIPVVALTFLFGGVTFRQLLANYAFLFVLSTLLCAWALSVSSSVQSTQRAVIGAYAGAMLAAILFWIVAVGLAGIGALEHYVAAYGYAGSAEELGLSGWRRVVTMDAFQQALYIYVIPLALVVLLTGLFFLRIVVNLSPPFADVSLAPRVYYLFAMLALILLSYAGMAYDGATASVELRSGFIGALCTALLLTSMISTLFATERAVPPAHIESKYAALTGLRRWRLLLAPGAQRGSRFCLLVNLFLLVVSFFLFAPFTAGMARGIWEGRPDFICLLGGLGTVIPWLFALCGLGSLLAAYMPRWPNAPKAFVAVVAGALTVLPIIHWAIWMSFDRPYARGHDVPGPWTLGFSPIVAQWSAMLPHETRDGFPTHVDLFGARVSVMAVYCVVYVTAGVAMHLWAAKRIKTLRASAPTGK